MKISKKCKYCKKRMNLEETKGVNIILTKIKLNLIKNESWKV